MSLHAMSRIGLIIALLVGITGTAHAMTIDSDEFKDRKRAVVTFDHDAHADLYDCATCHHGEKDGVIDREEYDVEQPCADCHAVNAPSGRTPLMRAFHQQCIDCHRDLNQGPTTCGGCHK